MDLKRSYCFVWVSLHLSLGVWKTAIAEHENITAPMTPSTTTSTLHHGPTSTTSEAIPTSIKASSMMLFILGGVTILSIVVILVAACVLGIFSRDKEKPYQTVEPHSRSDTGSSFGHRDSRNEGRLEEGRSLLSLNPDHSRTISHISSLIEEDQYGYLIETPSPRSRNQSVDKFSRDTLYFKDVLGEGEFGYVLKAQFRPQPEGSRGIVRKSKIVAVKCPKLSHNKVLCKEFVQEAMRITEFNHPNVLSVIGVCPSHETDDLTPTATFGRKSQGKLQGILPLIQHAPWAIIPYFPKGDLKTYLYNVRVKRKTTEVSLFTLISFAVDICKGMQYLVKKGIVHRDLAARNCLLGDDNRVVVSDFGLSRSLYYNHSYYRVKTKRPLPVKWMALECIENNIFSEKSDVWSFGVTFWEILSFSINPYPGVESFELTTYLRTGSRLLKPVIAPNDVWKLMLSCWKEHPIDRPKFSSLLGELAKMAKKYHKKMPQNIVRDEMIPEPPPRTMSLESFMFPPVPKRHNGSSEMLRNSEIFRPYVQAENGSSTLELSPVFAWVC